MPPHYMVTQTPRIHILYVERTYDSESLHIQIIIESNVYFGGTYVVVIFL